jgi:ATP-dependent DNA helicase DinG
MPGLRWRGGQVDMALAVAESIDEGSVLAVEAGTGVGKTWGYLVPLLLSGRNALISTATQALQEQLALRDIPAMSQALGLPVSVALLKGRASYLCLHRLGLARQTAAGARVDPAHVVALEQVHRWAQQTTRGDLAELPGLEERSALRPWISSTRDNCLGPSCPSAGDCHVNRARRAAATADWVVINHHVFLADVKENASTPRLPAAPVVVFDEAHTLADAARDSLAPALGQSEMLSLARDIATLGPLWARGMQAWALIALGVQRAAQQLGALAPAGQTRSRWQETAPEGLEGRAWPLAVGQLTHSLAQALQALRATADAAPDMRRLLAQCESVARTWSELTQSMPAGGAPDVARWLSWGADWRLQKAPLDDTLLRRALDAMHDEPGRSWVFTSSTLGHDETLGWFTQRLALSDARRLRTLRVASPFDHAHQSALYVPEALPEPGQPAHAVALADAVAAWAWRLGGRTLVLCTSLRAVARIAERLRLHAASTHAAPFEVLAQGDLAKRALLARFRAANGHAAGAVLVASATFWEGVDLAGDVLQLVVIDKLPFPSPDDPLLSAHARRLRLAGQSGFETHDVPITIQALRQGVGRLIRSETDRGVVVIADRRLLTKSYGPVLLASLPPMRRLNGEAQLLAALDELALTRASTTGHCPA